MTFLVLFYRGVIVWSATKNCDFITDKDAECHFQLYTHTYCTNTKSFSYHTYIFDTMYLPTTRERKCPRIFKRHLRTPYTFASVETVIEPKEVSKVCNEQVSNCMGPWNDEDTEHRHLTVDTQTTDTILNAFTRSLRGKNAKKSKTKRCYEIIKWHQTSHLTLKLCANSLSRSVPPRRVDSDGKTVPFINRGHHVQPYTDPPIPYLAGSLCPVRLLGSHYKTALPCVWKERYNCRV